MGAHSRVSSVAPDFLSNPFSRYVICEHLRRLPSCLPILSLQPQMVTWVSKCIFDSGATDSLLLLSSLLVRLCSLRLA